MIASEQLLTKSILGTGNTARDLFLNLVPNTGVGRDVIVDNVVTKPIVIEKIEKYVTISKVATHNIIVSKQENVVTVSKTTKNITV